MNHVLALRLDSLLVRGGCRREVLEALRLHISRHRRIEATIVDAVDSKPLAQSFGQHARTLTAIETVVVHELVTLMNLDRLWPLSPDFKLLCGSELR